MSMVQGTQPGTPAADLSALLQLAATQQGSTKALDVKDLEESLSALRSFLAASGDSLLPDLEEPASKSSSTVSLSALTMSGLSLETLLDAVGFEQRRTETKAGMASLEVMNRNQELLFQTAAAMKVKPGELREKAEQVMSEMKNLNHTLEKFRAREAANEAERFLFAAHEVGGLKVLTATVPDADAGKLRKMGDLLRDKEPSVVGVLAAVSGDKITFLAVCGKEAVKAGVKAGDIVKQVSAIAGGSGGGKPDSAMGGGKDPLMLDNALAMVDNVVSMKLGL